MSETVIRAENLGKQYQIGTRPRYRTIRESLMSAVRIVARFRDGNGKARRDENGSADRFWALQDINFEVRQGEVIGIIGRNGAGKSTLLKVLARITEPTTGQAEIIGRVGSLLEVGTGFHPELTGRENIYLNGAILGMRRSEIDRKFDEIVAFSEIEKFLDTAVKHYSSGMYTRLAFSVAAHLEPEILIVDEVLAVGDAAFQRKCLGKMKDVAGEGRTVLFVSHNLGAMLELCSRAILLVSGKLDYQGSVNEAIQRYAARSSADLDTVRLDEARRYGHNRQEAKLMDIQLASQRLRGWCVTFGTQLQFQISVRVDAPLDGFELGIGIHTQTDIEVCSMLSSTSAGFLSLEPGLYQFDARLDSIPLVPGFYRIALGLRSARGMEDYIPEAVHLEIAESHKSAEQKTHAVRGLLMLNANISYIAKSAQERGSVVEPQPAQASIVAE